MSDLSKYKLRKRIKELENEVRILRRYKVAFRDVFEVACYASDSNQSVKNSYILRKAKDIME